MTAASNIFPQSDHSSPDYNDVDPTSGFVSYKGPAEAQELGLLKTVGEDFYLGVDSKSTLNPNGIGRASVRLESKSTYKKGLFVGDFTHFPKPTCGTWPAFWTFGKPWPKGGEVDIYEAWNLDSASRFVMHTESSIGQCTISPDGMTSDMQTPNCSPTAPGQNPGTGCAARDPEPPYASETGGIYAMEWTDSHVRIWAFTHDNTPSDLLEGRPDPTTWGMPRFATGDCEVSKLFSDAQIIMNINFCGVAGHPGHWDTCEAETGESSCQAFVANNPKAFKNSFFQVRSIKIYQ
ncbi:glycoside hydrolase family 16 protein, partial [Sodiomyces alcalophilus JCM 7366]|uniref:glycoside hydrolase family 16 protein n=1 Tax=Sodiomyces alcalophilus JCM 7366 TaxID=591952 RepID=UPI0039B3BB44